MQLPDKRRREEKQQTGRMRRMSRMHRAGRRKQGPCRRQEPEERRLERRALRLERARRRRYRRYLRRIKRGRLRKRRRATACLLLATCLYLLFVGAVRGRLFRVTEEQAVEFLLPAPEKGAGGASGQGERRIVYGVEFRFRTGEIRFYREEEDRETAFKP